MATRCSPPQPQPRPSSSRALTNGRGRGLRSTPPSSTTQPEVDALRETKRDLEEKLAATSHENRFLTAEAFRLEGVVCQAMEDSRPPPSTSAAASEDEAATLRAEVKRLLAAEKSRPRGRVCVSLQNSNTELQGLQKEVVILEEELNALKASAACHF
ncbi:hypothetical protein GUJ93_ZPchr0005g15314 [Zizania palustris]|uniref:Uncharacterized protein n=1 Tax=Zizania palustris TaxID=103762 RepID=A0A8J5SU39_ZIZPA|nr:hypothetical protein GUJ93_ZPchr0005g15314 [Zizania palustris]